MSVMSEFSDLDVYINDHYTDGDYYHEETVLDIWNNCVVLSVYNVLPTILKLIILNFLFGCILSTGIFTAALLHILNGCIGIYLINTIESSNGKLILLGCWIIAFVCIQISSFFNKFYSTANALKILFIALLILCEYYFVEPETWLQIRGIVMILVMKIISLADDIEKSRIKPNLVQYFGYTLCGANVMFGPWISFNDYLNLFKKPIKKNLVWLCSIIKVLATSLLFLTLSNCWSNFFISENSNRWLIAYKEAFAFRTSHYFVSYIAEASMLAAGFTKSFKKDPLGQYRFTVTEPLEIEFPTSLSVVVKKWNQPMHEFLKKYVYYSWLSYGKFWAIFATFLMSSFLHGLEIKVSVVLVSIGVFSYVQVALRDSIAKIFDCCIRVRPCRDCRHKYKRGTLGAKIILLAYALATVFHLAYLGVLMDPSTDEIGIYEKWQNLYFVSHIVMFFNVMMMETILLWRTCVRYLE